MPGNNSKAVASMVVGILSVVCCGAIVGIVAIVLGILARNEINASGGVQGGSGMALAGIILGALGIVSSIGWWSLGFYDSFF